MALPGFVDPNAAAAANAGRGLASLGNFLYEQQVQKPFTQAQTAAVTAQTGAIPGQIARTAAETQAQNLANQATQTSLPSLQQQAIFAQGSRFNPDKASVRANNPPPAPLPGSSGGDLGSVYRQVLPNTQPPSQAGSSGSSNSTAGAPQAAPEDWTKPGTLAQPKPALPLIDRDALAPSFNDTRTPSKSPTTSPAPPTGMAVPPINPPASVTTPGTGFDMRQHLTEDIMSPNIPESARQSVLEDLRAPFTAAKVPVSDSQLIAHYRDQQQAYLPTMRQMVGGMTPTTAKIGGAGGGEINLVNSDALGAVNTPPGFVRDPVTMDLKADPNFAAPPAMAETQEAIATLDQTQRQLDLTKAAIARTPGIVGGVKGQFLGKALRTGQADLSSLTGGAAGTTIPQEDQLQLERFQSGQFLDNLAALKGIGRMDVPVVLGSKETIPKSGDPAGSWNAYFTKVETALAQKRQIVMSQYARQLKSSGGQPQAALGPVTPAPDLSTPGAPLNTVPGIYPTPDSPGYNAIPKGAQFQTAPGVWYKKS